MFVAHSLKNLPDFGGPAVEEVRSYLRELLGREEFSASERNRRFLSYIVLETLEGRADRIKAYNIALAAFDRTEGFDPLTDPIVRIEAGRLRRSLEHYYLTAGQADRIRIDIPKGSYAATFSYREGGAGEPAPSPISREISDSLLPCPSAVPRNVIRFAAAMAALGMIVGGLVTYGMTSHATAAAPGTSANWQPSLVIIPFEDTGGDPSRAFIARGLTYDVGAALTQLGGVAVFGPGQAFDSYALSAEFTDYLTLMGSVQTDQNSMRVAVFLVDPHTGQFLKSWSFQKELTTSGLVGAQAEVAKQIIASLQKDCATDFTKRATAAVNGTFDCRPVAVAVN